MGAREVLQSMKKFFFFSDQAFSTRVALLLLIVAGTLFRIYVWSIQPGTSLDDEIGHFIVSRDAWSYPKLIFSVWGRTACTLFYMPGAYFGLVEARLMSVIAATLSSFFAVHVAKDFGLKRLWLVPIFLECQPWFFNNMNEVLTQPPLLLSMIVAAWLFQRERYLLVGVLIGSLSLYRHEYVILTGLWVIYCLFFKQWRAVLCTSIPVVLVNVCSFVLYNYAPLQNYFSGARGTTFYGSGGWSHYLKQLVNSNHAGLPVSLLALAGIVLIVYRRKVGVKQYLLVLWFLAPLIVNTVIYRFGLFSSGGFGLFIMPVVTMLAILAALTLDVSLEAAQKRYLSAKEGALPAFAVYGVCLLFSILTIGFAAANVKAQKLNHEAITMEKIAGFIQAEGLQGRRIAAMNVWTYYYTPLVVPNEGDRAFTVLWTKNELETLDSGDLVVWDRRYSDRWGHKWSLLREESQFRLLRKFERKEKAVGAVFEKL